MHLASRGTQTPIRRNCHAIEETIVTKVVGLELAVGKVPYLRKEGRREGERWLTFQILHLVIGSVDLAKTISCTPMPFVG